MISSATPSIVYPQWLVIAGPFMWYPVIFVERTGCNNDIILLRRDVSLSSRTVLVVKFPSALNGLP